MTILLGALDPWNFIYFPIHWQNVIILTDEVTFFRGVGSTTNQLMVKIPMMVNHNHHY